MKALTLQQPWATLVATGAKRIETRSWATRHRGPLAIHAGLGLPSRTRVACGRAPLRELLEAAGAFPPEGLPRGAVLAVAELAGCVPMGPGGSVPGEPDPGPDDPERFFGDYRPGRFAWLLRDVCVLAAPVPARGALGLWEWQPSPAGA